MVVTLVSYGHENYIPLHVVVYAYKLTALEIDILHVILKLILQVLEKLIQNWTNHFQLKL